jgi:hypothetical protein
MPTKAQLTAELETLRETRNMNLNLMKENHAAAASLQAEKDAHRGTTGRLLAALEENQGHRDRSRSRNRRSRQNAECLAEADRGAAAAALRIVCKNDRDPAIEHLTTRVNTLEEQVEAQHKELQTLRQGDGEIFPILLRRLTSRPYFSSTTHDLMLRRWGEGQTVMNFLDALSERASDLSGTLFGYVGEPTAR